MVRTLIVMALLASLFYTILHWQPLSEPTAGKVVVSRVDKASEDSSGPAASGFNPAVPESLPDVEKGYVFSEKRKIEKDLPAELVKPLVVEPGPEVLDSVIYIGSVIIGDLRRALVIFQEPSPNAPAPVRRPTGVRRPGPPPAPATASASSPQNKQLYLGDRLLGFGVAAIEPNRIVFEKGTLKVEKFLYDRNKKRLAVVASRSEASTTPANIISPEGIPLEAMVPPEVAAEVAASPEATKRFMSGGGVAVVPPQGLGGDGAGGEQATAQSARMVRRSQRLFGAESSIKMPFTPVPGRPVPIN